MIEIYTFLPRFKRKNTKKLEKLFIPTPNTIFSNKKKKSISKSIFHYIIKRTNLFKKVFLNKLKTTIKKKEMNFRSTFFLPSIRDISILFHIISLNKGVTNGRARFIIRNTKTVSPTSTNFRTSARNLNL